MTSTLSTAEVDALESLIEHIAISEDDDDKPTQYQHQIEARGELEGSSTAGAVRVFNVDELNYDGTLTSGEEVYLIDAIATVFQYSSERKRLAYISDDVEAFNEVMTGYRPYDVGGYRARNHKFGYIVLHLEKIDEETVSIEIYDTEFGLPGTSLNFQFGVPKGPWILQGASWCYYVDNDTGCHVEYDACRGQDLATQAQEYAWWLLGAVAKCGGCPHEVEDDSETSSDDDEPEDEPESSSYDVEGSSSPSDIDVCPSIPWDQAGIPWEQAGPRTLDTTDCS